jgi:ABC-type polysaccharide/polyol phosphate transport system ATPase subunit
MTGVVQLDSVSKVYLRRSREFLHTFLAGWLRRAPKGGFYALKNVSLRLDEGDSLAVVGANGAGKSTLLSVIAGLSWPDEGKVTVNGRIAALLELGSGFHPDLTGAENLRLNAAVLGLTHRKTEERFDEIVEFSEIGDFIDEPLRTYSAGMIMRLAFSVAMNVQPDILLIDEVLAVGDQAFQRKCMDGILELKRAGRILICASHVPETLRQLCTRAIWLDHGRVIREGLVTEVLDEYQSMRTGAGKR